MLVRWHKVRQGVNILDSGLPLDVPRGGPKVQGRFRAENIAGNLLLTELVRIKFRTFNIINNFITILEWFCLIILFPNIINLTFKRKNFIENHFLHAICILMACRRCGAFGNRS